MLKVLVGEGSQLVGAELGHVPDPPSRAGHVAQELQSEKVFIRIQSTPGLRPDRGDRRVTPFPYAKYVGAEPGATTHHGDGMVRALRMSVSFHA